LQFSKESRSLQARDSAHQDGVPLPACGQREACPISLPRIGTVRAC